MLRQPYRHKIFVPGNHDFVYSEPAGLAYIREKHPGLNILLDSQVEIDGVLFYGTPWTLPFYDWAFMKEEPELKEVYSKVPDATKVLITHGPPYSILDKAQDGTLTGSKSLLERVANLKDLKYNIFGHIHEEYGYVTKEGVNYINASVLSFKYKLINQPWYFEL